MNKDLCQDIPEQDESQSSASLPTYQSGPEKSLGQIAWEAGAATRIHPYAWEDVPRLHPAYNTGAQAVRNAVIEECCRAICTGCKRGEPVALGPNGYYHGNLTSAICDCDASDLRSLKGKANDTD